MKGSNFQASLRKTVAATLMMALLSFGAVGQQSPDSGPVRQNGQQQQLANQVREQIAHRRQLAMATLRDQARSLQGPTIIDDVTFPQQTLAGLLLVRDVYMQQLRTFAQQAREWKKLTRGQKREVIRALDEYNSTYIITGDVTTAPARPQRQDVESRAHLRLATEFQPLLSVGPSGALSSTFSDVLLKHSKDPDKLVETFDQYLHYGIQGADDEIWRVQPINTVEGIAEFLSPQYQNTWAAASNIYGKDSHDLLSTLPEFAASYQQVRRGQKDIKRLKMAAVVGTICIVAAAAAPVAYLAGGEALVATGNAIGSGINLGVTGFQFAYDGSEFYGTYREMSSAQKGGGALQADTGAMQRQVYLAGAGVALDGMFVGMAAWDFNNAVQGLKVLPGVGAAADNAGASSTDAVRTETSVAGPTGTEIGAKRAPIAPDPPTQIIPGAAGAAVSGGQRLSPEALQGVQRARAMGIPENEIERALQSMRPRLTEKHFADDLYRASDKEILFEGVNQLENLEREALGAGVSRQAIQTAYRRASQEQEKILVAFGRRLPAELRFLTARAKGACIVGAPGEVEELHTLVGNAADAAVERKLMPLMILGGKLDLMRKRRLIRWSEEEMQLLRDVMGSSNRANLYAFGESEDFGQVLIRLFNEQRLQTADQFLNAANRGAIEQGKAGLPEVVQQAVQGTLPLLPPTELANPVTGQWINPEQVRALTSSQIQRTNPEVVQSLNDGPLKTALTARLMSEAANLKAITAVFPPPQAGHGQMAWATNVLHVLGGGGPEVKTAELKPPKNGNLDSRMRFGDEQTPVQSKPQDNSGSNSGNGGSNSAGSTDSKTKPDDSNSGGDKRNDGDGKSTKPENGSSVQGAKDGANVVGASFKIPALPVCKKSDNDCSELARFAADLAIKALHAQGDAEDQIPSLESEIKYLNDPILQSEAAKTQAKARAQELQGKVDALKANAKSLAEAAKQAWEAYHACLRLPKCPGAGSAGNGNGSSTGVGTGINVNDSGTGNLPTLDSCVRAREWLEQAERWRGYAEKDDAIAKEWAATSRKDLAESARMSANMERAQATKFEEQAALALRDCGQKKAVQPPVQRASNQDKPLGGVGPDQPLGGNNAMPGGGGGADKPKEDKPQNAGGSDNASKSAEPERPNHSDGPAGKGTDTPTNATPGENGSSRDVPLPPGFRPVGGSRTGEIVAGDPIDLFIIPGRHIYIDPDTGDERIVRDGGRTNRPGEPEGWWGIDPQTGKLTWHPRQLPPPPVPGDMIKVPGMGYKFVPATNLQPGQTKPMKIKIWNQCPEPQSFKIATEGFPAGMVQSHSSIGVGGKSSVDSLVMLDARELKGLYKGNIVITCTSCSSDCKQDRQVFPMTFLVSDTSSESGMQAATPAKPVVLATDIHPGDYTAMDEIVREHLLRQGETPSEWTAAKNQDGSLTYTTTKGVSLNAKIENGQVVIR